MELLRNEQWNKLSRKINIKHILSVQFVSEYRS